jgi:hypothetical protein
MKILFELFVMRNKQPVMRNQVGQEKTKIEIKKMYFIGGRLADLPPPPVSLNPDYVQCPHCGRNYAPMVAERHIPKCVNIQNKPRPPPPPAANRMGNQQRMGPGMSGGNTGRTPITNYKSSSGGFGNNAAYPPPNRATRGGRY